MYYACKILNRVPRSLRTVEETDKLSVDIYQTTFYTPHANRVMRFQTIATTQTHSHLRTHSRRMSDADSPALGGSVAHRA